MKTNSINNSIGFGMGLKVDSKAAKRIVNAISPDKIGIKRTDNLKGVVDAFKSSTDVLAIEMPPKQTFWNNFREAITVGYSQTDRSDVAKATVSVRRFLDNPAKYIKSLAGENVSKDIEDCILFDKKSTENALRGYAKDMLGEMRK